jgi:hypothetical protein
MKATTVVPASLVILLSIEGIRPRSKVELPLFMHLALLSVCCPPCLWKLVALFIFIILVYVPLYCNSCSPILINE